MPDTRCPSHRVSKLTGSLNEGLLNSSKPEALVCPSSSVGTSVLFQLFVPHWCRGDIHGNVGGHVAGRGLPFSSHSEDFGRLFK